MKHKYPSHKPIHASDTNTCFTTDWKDDKLEKFMKNRKDARIVEKNKWLVHSQARISVNISTHRTPEKNSETPPEHAVEELRCCLIMRCFSTGQEH